MHTVPTYTATIYCGLRERYAGTTHSVAEAEAIAQAYVDSVGLCVSVTPCRFVYTGGAEDGVAVGFINYPRFPDTPAAVRAHALALAEKLRVGLGQLRVSVVMPDETVMTSDPSVAGRETPGGGMSP